MSLKLGNTGINKLYLGSTEINKAYLGAVEVFTSAVNEYYLNLDYTNDDLITFSSVPSWATVNDMDFDITFKMPVIPYTGAAVCLFSRTDTSASRIELFISNEDQFYFRVTTSSTNIIDIVIPTITAQLLPNVIYNVNYLGSKLYLDAVEILDNTSISGDSISSGGALCYLNTRPYAANSGFDVEIHNIKLSGENYPLTEGSGFGVASDGLGSGLGSTSNAGGLTYWNSTVWTLKPVYVAEYQAVLDRGTTEGFTLPSAGEQIEQNQLMADLIANGLFAKANTIGIFTKSNSDFSRIDWKDTTNIYSAVNSPLHNTITGFDFDTTNYLLTGSFVLDDNTLINNHGASANISSLISTGSGQTMYGYREFSPSNIALYQGFSSGGARQGSLGTLLTSVPGTYTDDTNYYTTRNGTDLVSSYEGVTLFDSIQDVGLTPIQNTTRPIAIGGSLAIGGGFAFGADCSIKHFIYAEDMDDDLSLWDSVLNNYYA